MRRSKKNYIGLHLNKKNISTFIPDLNLKTFHKRMEVKQKEK